MAFIIIKSNSEAANKILGKWYRGENRKDMQKQFIRYLGNGTYLTELTGEMIALIWSMRKNFDNRIDLFLSEKNKDKFIHLVESTCSLDAERPFTLKKLSEIETNIKQIQSIFEDDLINPIMNKQLINTLKKLIAKILKWQP